MPTSSRDPANADQRRRTALHLRIAVVGGILVLNSLLAKWIFYRDQPYLSTVSAVAGTLILLTPILLASLRDVMSGRFYMNELVAIAVLAGLAMEKYQEAGIIAFFCLIAITIEEQSAIGAQAAIEHLVTLTPRRCRKVMPGSSEPVEISVDELKPGDLVRVRPGDNFPADGIVVSGAGTVNQASITGESLPVDKAPGAEVYAGTINVTNVLEIEVRRIGRDTTLGKIGELIAAAQQSRHPLLRIADRYAAYYTPTILMIAAIVWFLSPDPMRVILILVVSCPCALVVATPSAILATVAAAARRGMYVKNVAHIETAAQITAVVFDKTGTITEGTLEVSRLQPVDGTSLTDLVRIAASVEAESNHPMAAAVRKLARETHVAWQTPTSAQEIPGKGVVAALTDGVHRVGRDHWLREMGVAIDDDAMSAARGQAAESMSIVHVAKDNRWLGWIGTRDAIRPSAAPSVAELTNMGIRRCALVSGDHPAVTQAIAEQAGIRHVQPDCLPEQKLAYINHLKTEGHSVMFVGDGVNDAPALASADIGVAMGELGSDVAVNSATIALMSNDLRRIPFFIRLCRRCRSIIHWNLLIGAALIIGGMILFVAGDHQLDRLAGRLHLTPSMVKALLAASAQVLGTLAVFFNSARLIRFVEER